MTLFEEFEPSDSVSLVTSWENYLETFGYESRPDATFWDSVATHPKRPSVKARRHRGPITSSLIRRISLDEAPIKVIFIEKNGKSAVDFVLHVPILSGTRTALYLRDSGWLCTPSQAWADAMPEVHPLSLVKNWEYDESHGQWFKECRKCHNPRTPGEFYLRSKKGVNAGRDPYTSVCKSCEKARWRKQRKYKDPKKWRGTHGQ